jgi:integrase
MAWIYKQAGSKKWWIGWRANGRQFLKSTGTTDKTSATQKLREQEFLLQAQIDGRLTEQFYEALTGKSLPNVTLAAAAKDWLAEARATTARGTVEKYEHVCQDFLEYVRASETGPLLRDVKTEEVRQFLNDQRTRISAKTANVYRKILSGFFIRGLKNEIIKSNPALPIKPFKADRGEVAERRSLTMEEVVLIYSKAPNDFWRYMILAGFYTGLRLGDLATMKWGSIDFDQNIIRVTTIKTGRPMQIPIAAPLCVLLLKLRPSRKVKPGDYVWPENAERYLKFKAHVLSNEFYDEVLTPAGLAQARNHKKGDGRKREQGVSFHCLRHTFVSFLKITGSNNAVAKELAGHSSDAISDVYTHLPVQTLQLAISQLPEITK